VYILGCEKMCAFTCERARINAVCLQMCVCLCLWRCFTRKYMNDYALFAYKLYVCVTELYVHVCVSVCVHVTNGLR
jgi:hypothetical protein